MAVAVVVPCRAACDQEWGVVSQIILIFAYQRWGVVSQIVLIFAITICKSRMGRGITNCFASFTADINPAFITRSVNLICYII